MPSFCDYDFVSAEYLENESNFGYALILTRSRLGLLGDNFCQFVTELWSLMIHDFCQNFLSAQYL